MDRRRRMQRIFSLSITAFYWIENFLPWTKLTQHSYFYATFDRSKIESCCFHRWKEEMKTDRKVYYKVFQIRFLRLSKLGI
jgi:hypothetical protein